MGKEFNKEDIFMFAYGMAMRDATLQMAYYEQGLINDKKRLLDCKDAREIVKKYIINILDGPETLNFYETEKKVEEAFEKYNKGENCPPFTFGNTQKLINMTAKYFFISCYHDHDPALFNRFEKCHCPMDSRMIEIVIKQLKDHGAEQYAEANATEYMEADGVSMTWRAYLRRSWSNIGKENSKCIGQYKYFQKIVEYLGGLETPYLSPLEFDYKYWK